MMERNGKSLIKKLSNKTINKIWGLTLRESVIISIFGAMTALSKFMFKVSLQIPGHSGLIWMILLSLCCLLFRNGRAGSLAGIISGLLVFLLFPGKEGILTIFKYFIPGFCLDMILLLHPKIREKWYLFVITSSISYTAKLLVNLVSGLLLKIPFTLLLLGLKLFFINHLLFGLLGGLVGFFIFNKIPKHFT
jgi:hypothetical protein